MLIRRSVLRPPLLVFVALALVAGAAGADPAELLASGKWAKAEKKAAREADELVRQGWRDPDLEKRLGELARVRAVAAAGLGEDDRALWFWHLAVQLHLPLRLRAAEQPGRAGELFAAHPLRARGNAPPGVDVPTPPLQGRFEPPVRPALALGIASEAARRERPPPLLVEVLIRPDGRAVHPVVTGEPNPVVLYGILAPWADAEPFGPARLDGEPIPWLYPIEIPLQFSRW